MKKHTLSPLFSLLACLVLASCQLLPRVQPTATATQPPTPTRRPTATLRPPLPSFTVTPTLPSTPTLPPTPTRSPTPRRSPTPVPTLAPQFANLPEEMLSIGDPYALELGNLGYDVQHYTLKLRLDPATDEISASVTIEASVVSPTLGAFGLDFVGFEISAVTQGDTALLYQPQDHKLLVALPAPLARGDSFAVTVTYHGQPTIEASDFVPFIPSLGLFHPDQESLYFAAEPDGARYWFPCNDHPRDKATYRFEITVPQGLTAVANGRMVAPVTEIAAAFPNGQAGEVYTWEHNFPLASAFATVAVGPYERLEATSPQGVSLQYFVFSADRQEFEQHARVVGEMVDWMSDLFGDYPFQTFGYVTVRNFGASLETQSMVLLDTQMNDEETMIHELAHQWFGDWVSVDSWGDIWRSEGFATYISMMWEHRQKPEELGIAMRDVRDFIAVFGSEQPLAWPPRGDMFGTNSYYKGALLVQDLRTEIGDEAFFGGLRAYFEEYGGGSATQAQFQAVLEQAAGVSLDQFFAHWFK